MMREREREWQREREKPIKVIIMYIKIFVKYIHVSITKNNTSVFKQILLQIHYVKPNLRMN